MPSLIMSPQPSFIINASKHSNFTIISAIFLLALLGNHHLASVVEAQGQTDYCSFERHGCYKYGIASCCFLDAYGAACPANPPSCDVPNICGMQGPAYDFFQCFQGESCPDSLPICGLYFDCCPSAGECPPRVVSQVYMSAGEYTSVSQSNEILRGWVGIYQREGDPSTSLRLLYDVYGFEANCNNCKVAFTDSNSCNYYTIINSSIFSTDLVFTTNNDGKGYGNDIKFDIGKSLNYLLGKHVLFYNSKGKFQACALIDASMKW